MTNATETTGYELSVADIREIVETSGFSHAEFCIERTETQLGSEYTKPLRAELQRLIEEAKLLQSSSLERRRERRGGRGGRERGGGGGRGRVIDSGGPGGGAREMRTIEFTEYELNTLFDLAVDNAKDMHMRLDEALDREAAALDTDPEKCGDLVNARVTVDHWTKHAVRADTLVAKLK